MLFDTDQPDEKPMGFFGIQAAPREVAAWQQATGINVDLASVVETWDQDRRIPAIDDAEAFGLTTLMITWEPWVSVPATLPPVIRGRPQPHWGLDDIVIGDHDDYIRAIARQINTSPLETVYLSLMPYFNGITRPWCQHPDLFVSAWKRIVEILHETGGPRVRPVWSPLISLDTEPAAWAHTALAYWPGADYVDCAGIDIIRTMPAEQPTELAEQIPDGPDGARVSVAVLSSRVELLRSMTGVPVIATGVQAAWGARRAFDALATWVEQVELRGFILDQPVLSLGDGIGLGVDDLTWNLTGDDQVRDNVADIATAVRAHTV